VNRGSDVVGSGLLANDLCAFAGLETTSTELTVIDTIFQLNDQGKNEFGEGIRVDMVDSLV
jgi:translation initiation factor 6